MERHQTLCLLAWMGIVGCQPNDPPAPMGMSIHPDDLGVSASTLTAAERRVRAGQIRDAAAAAGIEQGWLLAGIADAETNMSHCWSELTWACMGPNSDDCGGGPVVAGASDGPCSAEQGGIGMFQFDAGTFDDTLRREGERILSIAGNTQAAVDFTVAMVMRSAYISGAADRERAISWMNGVRIDNDRWDAWIRTVTHYYNGCSPRASCFTSRYAHYRDRTRDVFNEMGAEFWETARAPVWAARFVAQTFPLARDPFPLEAGTTFEGVIEMRNEGNQTWRPGEVFLGTTEPRDGASPIADETWISLVRPATLDRDVPPGATGRFEFRVRAPETAGEYSQYFNLLRTGVAWFSESGGPADDVIEIRVQSVASMANEPDAGVEPRPGRDAALHEVEDAWSGPRSRDATIEPPRDGRLVGGCHVARTPRSHVWGILSSLLAVVFISRRRAARD